MLEARYQHLESLFSTFTYDEDHVPWAEDPDTGEIRQTLRKSDLTTFLKHLRKTLAREQDSSTLSSSSSTLSQVRYIARGEYGTKTERPHYHVIFFGLAAGYEETIDKLWKHGFTSTRQADSTNIRYTVKYLMKDNLGRDSIRLFGREPSYTVHSKQPPIGATAVPGLATALRGSVHIAVEGSSEDIPLLCKQGPFDYRVRIDGKTYPIDRTMVKEIKKYMRTVLGMSEAAILFCIPLRIRKLSTDDEKKKALSTHAKSLRESDSQAGNTI